MAPIPTQLAEWPVIAKPSHWDLARLRARTGDVLVVGRTARAERPASRSRFEHRP
jgi:hypothetical protein